jgi:hypothetical protein
MTKSVVLCNYFFVYKRTCLSFAGFKHSALLCQQGNDIVVFQPARYFSLIWIKGMVLSHSTILTMGRTLVKTCVEVTWESHQALAIVYDIWMHVRISKWVSGWPTKDHEHSPIIRTNEGL